MDCSRRILHAFAFVCVRASAFACMCLRLRACVCICVRVSVHRKLAVRMRLESRCKRISASRCIFCSRTFGTYYTQALHASSKHKACKPHPSWLTRLLLYFPIRHVKSCISWNIQWPWITVFLRRFLRRMESSDFTSILANWMHLTIYCLIALYITRL